MPLRAWSYLARLDQTLPDKGVSLMIIALQGCDTLVERMAIQDIEPARPYGVLGGLIAGLSAS